MVHAREIRHRALSARLAVGRAARFAVAGGVAGLTQLVLLHGALLVGWAPLLANSVAFGLAAQVNFWLSQRFTWRDRTEPSSARIGLGYCWLRFHAAIGGTALLNLAVFAVERDVLPDRAAAALGIGTAALANYLRGDRVVIRPVVAHAALPATGDAARPVRMRERFSDGMIRTVRARRWGTSPRPTADCAGGDSPPVNVAEEASRGRSVTVQFKITKVYLVEAADRRDARRQLAADGDAHLKIISIAELREAREASRHSLISVAPPDSVGTGDGWAG